MATFLCAAVPQAHEDRNLARKLTPAEKKEKKMKKLVGEASEGEVPIVTLFRVRDLSHKQLQFKVKVNAEVSRQLQRPVASCAEEQLSFCFTMPPRQSSVPTEQHWLGMQELHLTGCAVLTDDMCIVVAEGGIKAHKKYTKLMTHRIKWDVVPEEDEAGEV